MTDWHKKYLERLASVYLKKYETKGYTEAKAWYDEFLTEELKHEVRPLIVAKVEAAKKGQ